MEIMELKTEDDDYILQLVQILSLKSQKIIYAVEDNEGLFLYRVVLR